MLGVSTSDTGLRPARTEVGIVVLAFGGAAGGWCGAGPAHAGWRIVVAQARTQRAVEARDAGPAEGFHAFEPANGIRWTNRNAAVPETYSAHHEWCRDADGRAGGRTCYLDDGVTGQIRWTRSNGGIVGCVPPLPTTTVADLRSAPSARREGFRWDVYIAHPATTRRHPPVAFATDFHVSVPHYSGVRNRSGAPSRAGAQLRVYSRTLPDSPNCGVLAAGGIGWPPKTWLRTRLPADLYCGHQRECIVSEHNSHAGEQRFTPTKSNRGDPQETCRELDVGIAEIR